MSSPLILASESPRRIALLAQAGITPDAVRPASIDESVRKGELPRAHAQRLAAEKARKAGIFIVQDRCILKEHRARAR